MFLGQGEKINYKNHALEQEKPSIILKTTNSSKTERVKQNFNDLGKMEKEN